MVTPRRTPIRSAIRDTNQPTNFNEVHARLYDSTLRGTRVLEIPTFGNMAGTIAASTMTAVNRFLSAMEQESNMAMHPLGLPAETWQAPQSERRFISDIRLQSSQNSSNEFRRLQRTLALAAQRR